MPDLEKFYRQRASQKKENKKFFARLKKLKSGDLDRQFHTHHQEVFEQTNCLDCANCCKTTSPIFTNKDVDALSRYLGIKPSAFIEKYLKIDKDADMVLTTAPCPFLGEDNLCGVYDFRPQACREYPHTNRRKMHQILDLTEKNTMVCPAVLEIVGRMKREM